MTAHPRPILSLWRRPMVTLVPVSWRRSGPALAMGLAGGMVLLASYRAAAGTAQVAMLALGASLLVYGMFRSAVLMRGVAGGAAASVLASTVMRDPAATILTDDTGRILAHNSAASRFFDLAQPALLADCLATYVASPAATIGRLIARAAGQGHAVDTLQARGQLLRVTVLRGADDGLLLWRFDPDQAALTFAPPGADRIGMPMLTANATGTILFCNQALRQLVGKRPKTLFDLTQKTQLRSGEEIEIKAETGPISVMLVELASQALRREIYLLPMPGAPPLGAKPQDASPQDRSLGDMAAQDTGTYGAAPAEYADFPVALMLFAPDGRLRFANRAAKEILGAAPKADAYFHDLFDALGRPASDWLADIAEERLPTDSQVLRLHRPQGEGQNFVQLTLRRMVHQARPSVLAVIQDANALKTLEAQFVQSQKMQAIGQLAGGVAHDFNNLLTAISGNTDLLLLRHTGDDPSYPDLIQIRQNANRAAALVGQLLAFSRKQTLQPEYLDLQDVFSDLTHLLNRLVGEKLQLQLAHGADVGTIRADRRQLEQVIMNLVVNARDAMPTGGTISLATAAAHLPSDLNRNRAIVPAGDYAKITIADTGTGMSAEVERQIFEPFFSTKKPGEGTGLGLSTAYGIVKQSGGFIFVDSELGVGTTFTLYFPIHNRPAGEEPAAAQPRIIRQGEGVVLLVEDEAPVRAFAARALRLRGYTVLEASTGEEALDMLRDGGLRIDLFLSDVIMPGLDGPTWVREAQIMRPNVPVIFVSGYAEDVMIEHQTRIINSTFLPKPFSLAELTLVVQEKLQAA